MRIYDVNICGGGVLYSRISAIRLGDLLAIMSANITIVLPEPTGSENTASLYVQVDPAFNVFTPLIIILLCKLIVRVFSMSINAFSEVR